MPMSIAAIAFWNLLSSMTVTSSRTTSTFGSLHSVRSPARSSADALHSADASTSTRPSQRPVHLPRHVPVHWPAHWPPAPAAAHCPSHAPLHVPPQRPEHDTLTSAFALASHSATKPAVNSRSVWQTGG